MNQLFNKIFKKENKTDNATTEGESCEIGNTNCCCPSEKIISSEEHWENIYKIKKTEELTWYQQTPSTSLDAITKIFNLPTTAKIIDIGGGDTLLVDHLLELGYQDITVLDISETALAKAKQRLGGKAEMVKWIVADIAKFTPTEQYDFWNDRAAFHFLTQENEINHYVEIVKKSVKPSGILFIGTFSEQGPKRCSGLEIKQYGETSMTERFNDSFEKIQCITVDHIAPSGVIQNFLFCSFRKLDKS